MRVLVVEDFQLLRDFICQGLREAGFVVDAAGDGTTGLWQARTGAHDVIVLDVMLPAIDGLTILRRMRDEGIATHVLLLTAKDTTSDRILGLNAGADDYLVKPFEFGELLARVRALLRRKYKAKSPKLRVDDLQMDTLARTVTRGKRLLDLTPREYALLEFLMLRHGTVVTRTEIWEHVFEFNSEASSNVVDVFVGHLRKKVDADVSRTLIHTRRGHGYLLGVDE